MDPSAVQLGIMDGLPGLADAFVDAFPRARAARCWVHKARNVLPRVPKRYQAAFMQDWDKVQYAADRAAAQSAFDALEAIDAEIRERRVRGDMVRPFRLVARWGAHKEAGVTLRSRDSQQDLVCKIERRP